jgi:hypothetical protein
MVDHPISIPIGKDEIKFIQVHIAEIQEILKFQDEQNEDDF